MFTEVIKVVTMRWRETTYKGDAGRIIANPQKITTFLNGPSRSVLKKIGKIFGRSEKKGRKIKIMVEP